VQRLGAELVVDTSVVVKFFTEEAEDTRQADQVFRAAMARTVRLVAPDFLLVEFDNVLWRKTATRELTVSEAEGKLAEFQAFAPLLLVVPVAVLLLSILRTSCRYGHAAYDTAFLALAESRGIPFLTADKKFYTKFRPHTDRVLLLQNLPPQA